MSGGCFVFFILSSSRAVWFAGLLRQHPPRSPLYAFLVDLAVLCALGVPPCCATDVVLASGRSSTTARCPSVLSPSPCRWCNLHSFDVKCAPLLWILRLLAPPMQASGYRGGTGWHSSGRRMPMRIVSRLADDPPPPPPPPPPPTPPPPPLVVPKTSKAAEAG